MLLFIIFASAFHGQIIIYKWLDQPNGFVEIYIPKKILQKFNFILLNQESHIKHTEEKEVTNSDFYSYFLGRDINTVQVEYDYTSLRYKVGDAKLNGVKLVIQHPNIKWIQVTRNITIHDAIISNFSLYEKIIQFLNDHISETQNILHAEITAKIKEYESSCMPLYEIYANDVSELVKSYMTVDKRLNEIQDEFYNTTKDERVFTDSLFGIFAILHNLRKFVESFQDKLSEPQKNIENYINMVNKQGLSPETQSIMYRNRQRRISNEHEDESRVPILDTDDIYLDINMESNYSPAKLVPTENDETSPVIHNRYTISDSFDTGYDINILHHIPGNKSLEMNYIRDSSSTDIEENETLMTTLSTDDGEHIESVLGKVDSSVLKDKTSHSSGESMQNNPGSQQNRDLLSNRENEMSALGDSEINNESNNIEKDDNVIYIYITAVLCTIILIVGLFIKAKYSIG